MTVGVTKATQMSWEDSVQWLREQPLQHDLVRACFFDDPLVEAAHRFHASTEWQATRRLIPKPPGVALDVGAGRGIASFALATDGFTTTALEPDPSHLVGASAIRALSKEAGLPISVVEEWGESLPFPTAQFDVVLCRQVLHHARDLQTLCAEIWRVLKPGGFMVATREHVISKPSDLRAFLDTHPLHSLYGGEHAFLLAEYEAAIQKAGLNLVASLNPLQSDINLYPTTLEDHRARIARRLCVPKSFVTNGVLGFLGSRMTAPGRLYTFVAVKPDRT